MVKSLKRKKKRSLIVNSLRGSGIFYTFGATFNCRCCNKTLKGNTIQAMTKHISTY